jgi:hypothetical protein
MSVYFTDSAVKLFEGVLRRNSDSKKTVLKETGCGGQAAIALQPASDTSKSKTSGGESLEPLGDGAAAAFE